jgi:hypothetical protein
MMSDNVKIVNATHAKRYPTTPSIESAKAERDVAF